MTRNFCRYATCLGIALCVAVFLSPKNAAAAEKVKLAIPSLTLDLAPYWIAVEKGFFAEEGLDTEVVYIRGNTQGVQALIAGEVQAGAGGAAAPAGAVAQGAKVVVVSVEKNVMDYVLVSKQSVKGPKDLLDKKIAVSAIGGSSHVAVLMALKAFGADASRATMIQVGGSSARMGAVLKGSVFAAPVSGTVFAGRGEQFGVKKIVDLAEKGIDYPFNCLYTTRKFASENRKAVLGLIKGIHKGIRFFKENKDETLKIAARHLRKPKMDVLSREWEYSANSKIFQEVPYPTKEGFQALFEGMAVQTPKAMSLRMEDIVDTSFVDELVKAKFFKQ